MSGLLGRAAAIFFEAAESPPQAPLRRRRPRALRRRRRCRARRAGRRRARRRRLCRRAARAWSGGGRAASASGGRPARRLRPLEPEAGEPAARSPAGATTPGARRLAGRLGGPRPSRRPRAGGSRGSRSTRPPPTRPAQFRRARAVAGVPVVLAVAGPRPEPLEPLLAELDLCVAVLPADIDPALRELAIARLPGARPRGRRAAPARPAALGGDGRPRPPPVAARGDAVTSRRAARVAERRGRGAVRRAPDVAGTDAVACRSSASRPAPVRGSSFAASPARSRCCSSAG